MFYSFINRPEKRNKQVVVDQKTITGNIQFKHSLRRDEIFDQCQNKFENLSMRSKRKVVIGFCLISLCSNVYLIMSNLDKVHSVAFSKTPVSISNEIATANRQILITLDQVKEIERLKKYADSLSEGMSDKDITDSNSITKRPGMESPTLLKNQYRSQSFK
jgi:hypothetical protein